MKWIMAMAICAFLLTGCWDRNELNAISIVSSIGFDKQGDQIKVSIQVIDTNEVAKAAGSSGAGRAPVALYQEKGMTVSEALARMTKQAPFPLYLSHTRIVVISEAFAREEGIGKILDFLSRDRQIRSDFYL